MTPHTTIIDNPKGSSPKGRKGNHDRTSATSSVCGDHTLAIRCDTVSLCGLSRAIDGHAHNVSLSSQLLLGGDQ